jgi:transcriptional regulator with XRE-family HTH domain
MKPRGLKPRRGGRGLIRVSSPPASRERSMTLIERIYTGLGFLDGQSQEFAELAEVNQSTVSRWMRGEMQPTLAAISNIRTRARKKGLPWDDGWIFGDRS